MSRANFKILPVTYQARSAHEKPPTRRPRAQSPGLPDGGAARASAPLTRNRRSAFSRHSHMSVLSLTTRLQVFPGRYRSKKVGTEPHGCFFAGKRPFPHDTKGFESP
ncbi:hypothetical protein SEA_KENUHA5_38 [Mycobacterium phage Kenuha5]|nr:hypothetical protein SEA_KENUHA5_38 [Mycobacterium phage Kenuha5]